VGDRAGGAEAALVHIYANALPNETEEKLILQFGAFVIGRAGRAIASRPEIVHLRSDLSRSHLRNRFKRLF